MDLEAGACASGDWRIACGHFITLAELFYFGAAVCSCWELYRLYFHQPIFIFKRDHSVSTTENGRIRANARKLHNRETGSWALPAAEW